MKPGETWKTKFEIELTLEGEFELSVQYYAFSRKLLSAESDVSSNVLPLRVEP